MKALSFIAVACCLATAIATSEPTTPTDAPTDIPTISDPTRSPTREPTTREPTREPTTREPTTREPTRNPTREPTPEPTTRSPTREPTVGPTRRPRTGRPTREPTDIPSASPSLFPTRAPVLPSDDGAIIGAATAAAVVGTLAVALLLWRRRKRERKRGISLSAIEVGYGGKRAKNKDPGTVGQSMISTELGSSGSSLLEDGEKDMKPVKGGEVTLWKAGQKVQDPVLAPSKKFLERMQTLEAEVDELIGGSEKKEDGPPPSPKTSPKLSETATGRSLEPQVATPTQSKHSELAKQNAVVGYKSNDKKEKGKEEDAAGMGKKRDKTKRRKQVAKEKKQRQGGKAGGTPEGEQARRKRQAPTVESSSEVKKDGQEQSSGSPKARAKDRKIGNVKESDGAQQGSPRRRPKESPVVGSPGKGKKRRPKRKKKVEKAPVMKAEDGEGRQKGGSEDSEKGKGTDSLDALESMIAPSLEYNQLKQPRPISFGDTYVPKRRRRKLSSDGVDGLETSNPRHVAQQDAKPNARPSSSYLSRVGRSSTRSLFRPSSKFLNSFTVGSSGGGNVQRAPRRKRSRMKKTTLEKEVDEAI